jgi:hypothetical protein
MCHERAGLIRHSRTRRRWRPHLAGGADPAGRSSSVEGARDAIGTAPPVVEHSKPLVARQSQLPVGRNVERRESPQPGCQASIGVGAMLVTEAASKRHGGIVLVPDAWLGSWAWCSCARAACGRPSRPLIDSVGAGRQATRVSRTADGRPRPVNRLLDVAAGSMAA